MEASVESVAAKKVYVVPEVAKRGTVVETTLGVPSGIGEPLVGLIRATDV
jgi:hypothetical protein